jgi:hypothetical protein
MVTCTYLHIYLAAYHRSPSKQSHSQEYLFFLSLYPKFHIISLSTKTIIHGHYMEYLAKVVGVAIPPY